MADTTFSELRSARLLLRRLLPSDLPALCAYRSLPEVARYQSWESFTPADGERLLAQLAGVYPDAPGTWFQLAIVRDGGGEMIGDCGLHCRQDDPRQMTIGITLDPAHQGKGYASEALARLLDYVFGPLQKHRVTAVTDAENRPAAELLGRLGFRREGHYLQNVWFKGKWGDEFSFALLREEWGQRRRPSGSDQPF